ncbi:MAG: hypothetical protein AB4426_24725 [Xenococcaceae cyanobacterium]
MQKAKGGEQATGNRQQATGDRGQYCSVKSQNLVRVRSQKSKVICDSSDEV